LTRVNLYNLKIAIPTGFLEGKPKGYQYRSIADILNYADTFELSELKKWINEQFLDYFGWVDDRRVTNEVIARALGLMKSLGIKPKECIYEADVDEPDEQV
jgi:hypothetical protein